jgi:ribosomal protein S18 acetylase RimI-like enzyme
MSHELTRRPATKDDLDLIFEILRASLRPYVQQTWGVWDEAIQRQRFNDVTKVEDHFLLELSGQTVGCLCFKESATEVRLVRLFITPPYQNRGLGTQVMREIMLLGDRQSLPIQLRVLRVNPARRLYERLGFSVVGEDDTHYTMRRPPSTTPGPCA